MILNFQQGLGYKHVYQAGCSAEFLKQFELGLRYTGTRQDNDFLGADTGAFNEYSVYFTWHFALQHNFAHAFGAIGKSLPQGLPEASLVPSEAEFTPDGSGPIRTVTFQPHATADAGLLSWHVLVRNGAGETVHKWDGQGPPDRPLIWDGLGLDQKPLPPGTYQTVLEVSDAYGNEATSPAINYDAQRGGGGRARARTVGPHPQRIGCAVYGGRAARHPQFSRSF